jgi:Pentapeptide repeats (8 copies)
MRITPINRSKSESFTLAVSREELWRLAAALVTDSHQLARIDCPYLSSQARTMADEMHLVLEATHESCTDHLARVGGDDAMIVTINGVEVEIGPGASLSRASLSRADLYGADLSRADLSGANLTGADLSRADLSGANLTGADLYDADLYDADLCGANLTGADLSGADLCDADLCGANLTGADLSGARNLDKAIGLDKVVGEPATLPEGWRYDDGLIAPGAHS